VLVTCDVDNVASRKIIEHNGGILEIETNVEDHEVPIARYWIRLD
jgi:predicted acetyltransferase